MKFHITRTVEIEADSIEQAKEKSKEIGLGNVVISSILPRDKHLKGGVGMELRRLIQKFGFKAAPNCKCSKHAKRMNKMGLAWCEQNIDTIVGWLREEAKRANIPFIDMAGKILVKKAISNTKKRETNRFVQPTRGRSHLDLK